MLLLIFFVQLQVSSLNAEFQALNSVNTKQQMQLQNLELKVANNRKDAQLLTQLETIKLVIGNENKYYRYSRKW